MPGAASLKGTYVVFWKCSCILQPNYRMKKSIRPIFLYEISFSYVGIHVTEKATTSATYSTLKFSDSLKKYTDFCRLTWKFSPRGKRVSLGFNHIWSKTLSFLPDNSRSSFIPRALGGLVGVVCLKRNSTQGWNVRSNSSRSRTFLMLHSPSSNRALRVSWR